MLMYFCDKCRYGTKKISSIKNHVSSIKHVEILNGSEEDKNILNHKYVCIDCNISFITQSSYNRHRSGRGIHKKDAQIAELKKQVDEIIGQNKELTAEKQEITDKYIQIAEKYIQTTEENKEIITKYIASMEAHAETCKTALSLIKYLLTYFADTPNLSKPVEIFKKFDANPETDKELLYHFKNKTLVKYLGDFIIAEYKKKDHSEQTMWSSDDSRSTYVIKLQKWKKDKKGVQVTKIVISSIIDRVRQLCELFIRKCNFVINKQENLNNSKIESDDEPNFIDDIEELEDANAEEPEINESLVDENNYLWTMQRKYMLEWMCVAMDMLKKLDTGEIEKGILKYIGHEFDILLLKKKLIIKNKKD